MYVYQRKKSPHFMEKFFEIGKKKTNSKVDKVLFAYVQVTNDKGKNI